MSSANKQIRAARAAYQREYRKKNPDRIRQINERYWLNRARRQLAENQPDSGLMEKNDGREN